MCQPLGDTAISNGVVDIQVNHYKYKAAGDATVVNVVMAEINQVFCITSPTQLANFVMYCLPSGVMDGIVYAYINPWNSVYTNEWCNYVSSQVHEVSLVFFHQICLNPCIYILNKHTLASLLRFVRTQLGHNLNYAHSNEAGTYNDQTDMMGYSYFSDDGPIMCFNGAKSW
jgi:hypothetical protein